MKILIEGSGSKILDYPPLLLSKPADAIETKKYNLYDTENRSI
jgi:hypothetical protein